MQIREPPDPVAQEAGRVLKVTWARLAVQASVDRPAFKDRLVEAVYKVPLVLKGVSVRRGRD